MNIEPEDDLEGDLRAALAGDPAPEVIEVDPANETPVELPAEPQEPAKDGRERAPDGKFVAKTPEVEQSVPDQPSEAVADPAEKLAIRAPASWSPAAKAEFAALPAHVQQAVAKREQEIDHGLRRKSEEVKRYEPLEQVLSPRRQLWAAQGIDDATAVKTLLAAQDLLESDFDRAIEFLHKSYGKTYQAQPAGQPFTAQPAGNSQNPEFTALQQELAAIKQQITSQHDADVTRQIEAFRQDPANLYYENVRDEMAVLLQTGKARDLPEAYEMACWMRSDIRPFLQKAQVKPVADPAEVARKRAAGASVTGSPAEARGAPLNGNGSIEDDIRAAILEASGR